MTRPRVEPPAQPPPRLGVVLDFGAASPMSVLAAARGLADVVFVCDRASDYVRDRFDDLAGLCEVVDVTGRSDGQVHDRVAGLRLDGITTFSERQIVRTAALAHPLGLAYLSPATARAVTDKLIQRRRLADAGVEHTRCVVVPADAGHAELAAALDRVGVPAVVKPRSGAASAYTAPVADADEALARLRDFAAAMPAGAHSEFVVEELLAGDPAVAGPGWADYVSVESVTSRGRIRHVAVTGKLPLAQPLRETGYVIPSTLGEQAREAVLRLTTAALRALDVRDGATHVEVKLGPDGPRIIEVNGRVGGYVGDILRRAAGLDLVRLALAAALGQPPTVPPPRYRRHAFQYFLTPPMDAVAVRHVEGLAEVGNLPGVQAVEVFRQAGGRVDWRDGTLAYVGIVHGSAADHPAVLRLIDRINRTLRIEYRTAPPEQAKRLRDGSGGVSVEDQGD